MRRFLIIGVISSACLGLPCPGHSQPPGSGELAKGISAYDRQSWTESMGHFVNVLAQDPSNPQAHEYLDLLVQQIEAKQKAVVHDQRLAMLANVSKRYETNRMDTRPINAAINETATDEAREREERWHGQCIMAAMEERMGHLEAANNIVLRVLTENANNAEAQLLLSDLQSKIHEMLQTATLSSPERFALQGFYAYGQAEYRVALNEWTQTRAALQKIYSSTEAVQQVAALHFETYEKIAKGHVLDDEQMTRAQGFFRDGLAFYQNGAIEKALDRFRQVALINPQFPELGSYLAHSEAAIERDRTKILGEAKRRNAEEAFAQGLAALEMGNYDHASRSFKQVLEADPSDAKARTYLAQAEAQKNRHSDPTAARQHYEAGVIAWAGGHSEEAIREWHIALRLDPQNQKSTVALNKMQTVTELTEDLP